VLRPGAAADVVVFDPATVAEQSTFDEPRRWPEGIRYVLVNGVPVVDAGRATGSRPGRLLQASR
jgi:N-acyl-D-aspartate/D-glutamate deacylase